MTVTVQRFTLEFADFSCRVLDEQGDCWLGFGAVFATGPASAPCTRACVVRP